MTVLDMEKARAEFEAFAPSIGLGITRAPKAMMFANGRRVPVGGYILAETAAAWAAWLASRASVVVELPRPYLSGHTENGNHAAIDLLDSQRVRAAIEAAGVRWR